VSDPCIHAIDAKPIVVLVVDDVSDNLKILGTLLKNDGYSVIAATNGPQALDMAEAKKPDLILLDIQMPGMDGFTVCTELKKKQETAATPVVFLTARTDKQDIVRGFVAGGVDYVTKPFNTAELLARIRTHVDLKLMRDKQACLIEELQHASDHIKQLSGLLPICSNCKKIRDDTGYWQQIERYISEHSAAQFTHSLCPDCLVKLYPDLADSVLNEHDS